MHPAELAARESYGRLLSLLVAQTRDVAGAEDALSEAFLAAVSQWPLAGVPKNPEAWLLTIARRRIVDAIRRRRTREEKSALLGLETEHDDHDDRRLFDDERLRLLFLCAHPAIDAAARTPLMLQTVLGLDAARIANALRIAPKTMGQRLWRAKAKIASAGIPFEVALEQLPERAFAVLEAIYAAYGSGWEDVAGRTAASQGLTEEAIWLARLMLRLLPDEPEARGLLALMLFAESRAARAGAPMARTYRSASKSPRAGISSASRRRRHSSARPRAWDASVPFSSRLRFNRPTSQAGSRGLPMLAAYCCFTKR